MTAPRDFSIPDQPKRFRVDPDDFTGPAIISARTLKRFASMAASISEAGGDIDVMVEAIADAFRALLPGPDGERFAERVLSDGGAGSPPPLDLQRQVIPIMHWLLEEYGIRPTQPSSASAPGSTDGLETILSDGTDSTDGASPTETATT